HETLERVGAAGRERDLRHEAFGPVLRQARVCGGNRGVGTLGDRRDRDLAAPLAGLDDDRHVRSRRHVDELELAGLVGLRERDRIAGDRVGAAIADRAVLRRADLHVRHVDLDAVERQRPVRREHGAGDRRERLAVLRTVLDVALEADALVVTDAATVGRAAISVAALHAARRADRVARAVLAAVIPAGTRRRRTWRRIAHRHALRWRRHDVVANALAATTAATTTRNKRTHGARKENCP